MYCLFVIREQKIKAWVYKCAPFHLEKKTLSFRRRQKDSFVIIPTNFKHKVIFINLGMFYRKIKIECNLLNYVLFWIGLNWENEIFFCPNKKVHTF